MKIAGLDIGTTGCKMTVFDSDGSFLARAYRGYHVRRQLNEHEIDAFCIIESVYEVLYEIAQNHPDIAAIGVTSLGETFVLTDEDGMPLLPSMIYTDPRGAEECRELTEKLGSKEIFDITGLKPHEMYSICKLMWVKNHHYDIYQKAKYIFLIEDFVVWHLSHVRQIEYTLATRTMAFDVNTLKWSDLIFDAAGIDATKMSTPVPVASNAGLILKSVCEKTGISPECQIVSAAHDQVAGVIGCGVHDQSVAVNCSGTVECFIPVFEGMPNKDIMYKGSYCIIPFMQAGNYVTYSSLYSGGSLIKWFIDTFANGASHEDLEKAYGSSDPTNILLLPHFAGMSTPYMDIGSKGAFVGLTCETTLAEMYIACLQGIAFEIRINHDSLKDSGVNYNRFIASGGGACSSRWVQMKADILNMPFTTLKVYDTGTVGCSILAGLSIGIFDSVQKAQSKIVKVEETFYPNPNMHEKYNEIYERYKKLYDAIRPLV